MLPPSKRFDVPAAMFRGLVPAVKCFLMSLSRRMISPRTLIECPSLMRAGTPFIRATFCVIRSPTSPSPRVMASTILPSR